MATTILLHDDWEINGDGTGDPEKLMFEPARRLMDICDRYGAKYTFFAEVMQQFAMKESTEPKHQEWAEEWERILRDAVRRGHDVQLHLHPQWIGAQFREGRWHLDYQKWNLGLLDEETIYGLLKRGKEYLESLLRRIDDDYRVVAFRAGGWMCQPSGAIVNALERAGILADVSVVPGKYAEYGDLGRVDFRKVPSVIRPWRVGNVDVAEEGDRTLLEIPTYSEAYFVPLALHLLWHEPLAFWHYLQIFGKWNRKKEAREYSAKKVKDANMVSHWKRMGKFFEQRVTYGSFGYMHWRSLVAMLRNHEGLSAKTGDHGPVVLLTHSKSFFSYKNFEIFLVRIAKEDRYNYSTTQNLVRRLANEVTVNS